MATLEGEVRIARRQYRFSLHPDDARLATTRFEKERRKLVADPDHGDAMRSFDEVAQLWADFIARQVRARQIGENTCQALFRLAQAGRRIFDRAALATRQAIDRANHPRAARPRRSERHHQARPQRALERAQ